MFTAEKRASMVSASNLITSPVTDKIRLLAQDDLYRALVQSNRKLAHQQNIPPHVLATSPKLANLAHTTEESVFSYMGHDLRSYVESIIMLLVFLIDDVVSTQCVLFRTLVNCEFTDLYLDISNSVELLFPEIHFSDISPYARNQLLSKIVGGVSHCVPFMIHDYTNGHRYTHIQTIQYRVSKGVENAMKKYREKHMRPILAQLHSMSALPISPTRNDDIYVIPACLRDLDTRSESSAENSSMSYISNDSMPISVSLGRKSTPSPHSRSRTSISHASKRTRHWDSASDEEDVLGALFASNRDDDTDTDSQRRSSSRVSSSARSSSKRSRSTYASTEPTNASKHPAYPLEDDVDSDFSEILPYHLYDDPTESSYPSSNASSKSSNVSSKSSNVSSKSSNASSKSSNASSKSSNASSKSSVVSSLPKYHTPSIRQSNSNKSVPESDHSNDSSHDTLNDMESTHSKKSRTQILTSPSSRGSNISSPESPVPVPSTTRMSSISSIVPPIPTASQANACHTCGNDVGHTNYRTVHVPEHGPRILTFCKNACMEEWDETT